MSRANNLPPRWEAIARKHRERGPAGSPFSAFQKAMREASEEYHGRPVRRNPGPGLLEIIVIGGIAYYLLKSGALQKLTTPNVQLS